MDHNLINAVQEQLAACKLIQLVGTSVNTPTPVLAELRETFMVTAPTVKGYYFADFFIWQDKENDDLYVIAINFFKLDDGGQMVTLPLDHMYANRNDLETNVEFAVSAWIDELAESQKGAVA